VFARVGDLWTASALTENDTLALPEIGIELPIAECYLGLDLSPPTETEAQTHA
jgi:hypothetical protein